MLSRNNWKEQVRQQEPSKQRFTTKKLTTGVASALIGFTFMGISASIDAQTASATGTQTGITPTIDAATPIAPSTTVSNYDGTEAVDTPSYNNAYVW